MDEVLICGGVRAVNGTFDHLQPTHAVEIVRAFKDEKPEWHHWADRCERGQWTVPRLRKEMKTAKDLPTAEEIESAGGIPGACRLFQADVAEVGDQIEDESVDAIITDPPYGEKFIDTYGDLAGFAARVLKPGGSLLAMAGQTHLPRVIHSMQAMVGDLHYHWTLCYLVYGPNAHIWDRHVYAQWKPVLWFVKGQYEGPQTNDLVESKPEIVAGFLESGIPEKHFHGWGQSESGMSQLVLGWSKKGETVFDPFVGGGTTAAVSLALGRKFIGSDVSEEAIERTAKRIAGMEKVS